MAPPVVPLLVPLYRPRLPPTDADVELALLADGAALADDTDWEARLVAGVVLHTGPRRYELDRRIVAAPICALWG